MPAEDDTEPLEYSLFHTQSSNRSPPILITLKVNGADLTMELDTGATLSLISEQTYKKIIPVKAAPHLVDLKAQLKSIDVLPSKNQALCKYCTLVSKLKHC